MIYDIFYEIPLLIDAKSHIFFIESSNSVLLSNIIFMFLPGYKLPGPYC